MYFVVWKTHTSTLCVICIFVYLYCISFSYSGGTYADIVRYVSDSNDDFLFIDLSSDI